MKARKVRIYLSPEQRKQIDQWLDTARWTYNQCVADTKDGSVPLLLKNLRALFVNSAGLALQGASWVEKCAPYEIRDKAMPDLVGAEHACRAKNMADGSWRGSAAVWLQASAQERQVPVHTDGQR